GPRHAYDGREVHVLEVMRPVVEGRIEWKRFAFGGWDLLPELGHVARVEDGVDLSVHAVELNEIYASIQAIAFRRQVVRDLGHVCAEGQPLDDPLGGVDHTQRGAGARLELLPRRVRPRRRADGLAVAVAQRVLGEISVRLADDAPEAQRIASAGRGVIDTRFVVRRRI